MSQRVITPSGTPLYVAGDTSAARAIIVLQEAFGVNDHIRRVTDAFAEAGYYAVSPELFHREGSPEIPYDDFPAAMAVLGTLSAEGLRDDLEASASFLAEAGYDRDARAIVGYCMGGSVAFFCATLDLVGAAASFYGGGVETGRFGLPPLLELAPTLRCAWLGLYGDLDKGIPVEQVEALRAGAASSGQTTDVIRYANAEHGFNCDGRPAVYNADAAADATKRTLEFFAQHLRAN